MQLTIKKISVCCWLWLCLFSVLTAQTGVLDDIKDQTIAPQESFEIINIADFILPGVTCTEVQLTANRATGTDTKPNANACAKTQAYHSTMTARLKITYGNIETFNHPDDYMILYNDKNEVIECGGNELMFNDLVLQEKIYTLSINGGSTKHPVRMDFYSGKDKTLYQVDSVFQYVQNMRMGKTGEPHVIDLAPVALSFASEAIALQATVVDTAFRGTICYTIQVNNCDNGQTGSDQVCFSVGIPEQSCENSHAISAELFTGQVYRAATTIEANNIIQSTADISYFAGQNITLKSGFEVKRGGRFLAKIEACESDNLMTESETAMYQENVVIPPTAAVTNTSLQALDEIQLILFPNPVNQQLNIRYYLPKQVPISMKLLDANGRVVHPFPVAEGGTGWQDNSLNTEHLPMGIYFLAIQTTQQQLYRKVIVQR